MKPRALRPGDLIRIVSPASIVKPEDLEFASGLLKSEGYQVDLSPHALGAWNIFSATDEERARDLQQAFDDPAVSAVYCSRGGYGCSRLLELLDLDRIAASGKLLIGFSDITVLHTALERRGVPSLHAPMALTLSRPREPWVIESFMSSLAGGNPIPDAAPRGKCVVGGIAEGRVAGGCLILLCDSIGTSEPFDATGKIVLIEDVDENPHRVDAMLTHLLNEGSIKRAAGIIVGEMTRTDERREASIGGWPWREIVADRLGNLGLPLIIDFPFGHCAQMLSLPLGIRGRLNADAGTLSYLESHCA